MTKLEQVIAILQRERAKGITDKQTRKHCIPLIVAEVGMTPAGASTYLNMAKNHLDGKVPVKHAKTEATNTPFVSTGVDPEKLPVYSVVTEKDGVAVYNSCHFDPKDALEEGKRLGRRVVKGVQVIGKPFGMVLKGTTGEQ